MSSHFNISVLVFVAVRMIDFTGDGFMLYLLIMQWLRYFPKAFNTPVSSNKTHLYCASQEQFTLLPDEETQSFDSFSVRLLVYVIIIALAFIISPVLLSLALPSKDDQDELSHEIDESINFDFHFRTKVKGLERAGKYLLLVVMVVIHDIPLLALGTDLMTTLISTRGPRCYEYVFNICGSEDCLNTSNGFPLPYNTDYYWLLMMGTKLFGALGCVGYIMYLELRYRYELHALTKQRRQELLRRHFGQNRDRRISSYCGICFVMFFGAFLILIWTNLVLLAPTFTVLAIKTVSLQQQIDSTFAATFEIGSFVCWGAVGLLLLISIINVYCFTVTRKICCTTSNSNRD